MDIASINQFLSNRLNALNDAKSRAISVGDLEQINAIDKDLMETKNSIQQLALLASINIAAEAANTTTAEVVATGLDAIQDTSTIQGPSAGAIVNGYDISAYATDPLHETKIQNLVNAMPSFVLDSDIDAYIQDVAPGSPVTGEMVLLASNQYSVDVPLLLAIMQNDSAFGTAGVGARTNNPGNVGNTGSAERAYSSCQEGVTAVAEWLNRHRVLASSQVYTQTLDVQSVLTGITVTPSSSNIVAGATQQLVTNTLDQNGASIGGATIIFSSDNSSIATVDNMGIITAVSAGIATITAQATLNGTIVTGNSVVNVSNTIVTPIIAGVTISPALLNVLTGSTQQLTAIPIDHNGAVISGATITFSSSDKSIATVDNTGLVTAVSAGIVTISSKAVFNKNIVTGNSVVNINDPIITPVLANVSITPSLSNILTGSTQYIAVNAMDNNGEIISGATITFSSSKKSIATVDDMGLVTAISAGTATISIKAIFNNNTVTANSVINITDPVVVPVITNVSVNPTSANVSVGSTQQIITNTLDHNGSSISNAQITFTSDNSAIATVDNTGLVTAISAGTATITAQAILNNNTVTANSVITVNSPVVDTKSLSDAIMTL